LSNTTETFNVNRWKFPNTVASLNQNEDIPANTSTTYKQINVAKRTKSERMNN
jgi:hypothetical protein